MGAKELKTTMGWVSCPKDKRTHVVSLHCAPPPVGKCPYFAGKGTLTIYCTYEESTEEESQWSQ